MYDHSLPLSGRNPPQDGGGSATSGDIPQTTPQTPYLSDLAELGAYLFGSDKITAQRAMEAASALCAKSSKIPGHSRLRWLRHEFIALAVSLKRDELDVYLVRYRTLPKSDLLPFSSTLSCRLILDDDPQAMLHRVVLMMMFREGYAWRDCSRLLRTTEPIIEQIFEESLLWLSSEMR